MWQVEVANIKHGETFKDLKSVRVFLRSIASGQVRVSKAGKGWDESASKIFAWETNGNERDFTITKL